jgi:LPS sulfotransferase NodH
MLPAEPPPTRFVVLATPRTGSNWLCTLLDSHPEILCHHEIFNPAGIHYALSQRGGRLDFGSVETRDRDPLAVLERVWRETAGHPIVGFKIGLGQSEEVQRAVIGDPGVRKVVVHRANRIRTYVSEEIARRTGEWESYPWSELAERPTRVEVDPERLREHAQRNERYYAWVRELLAEAGQEALEVVYERLTGEPERRRLQRFLGVAELAPLRGSTRKQNPGALRELVSNFDRLAGALRGSPLAAELEASR